MGRSGSLVWRVGSLALASVVVLALVVKSAEAFAAASDPANPDVEISVSSVSCASPGNCSAVGDYSESFSRMEGLLLTETEGRWATGKEPLLPANAAANPLVDLTAVSCSAVGYCAAIGEYTDSAGYRQGLLLSETGGVWATGLQARPPANAESNPEVSVGSVSCASAGNCTAVGGYTDTSGAQQGLLLTETGGVWATGVQASLPANAESNSYTYVGSVSCASAGNCTAAGNYTDNSGAQQGLLLTETGGVWATGSPSEPAGERR